MNLQLIEAFNVIGPDEGQRGMGMLIKILA
jgi:hypothetical protein